MKTEIYHSINLFKHRTLYIHLKVFFNYNEIHTILLLQ